MKLKLWFILLLATLTTTIFAQPVKNSGGEVPAKSKATIFSAASANIEEEVDYASLLWEISGNDLESPSYLFGTIHIIGKDDYFWTDLMEEKFQDSEKLVLEIDMGKNQMMMMLSMISKMRMESGKTLHDFLTEDEYETVNRYFTDEMNMPLAPFDRLKPIFTSMFIAQGEAGGMDMQSSKSYEMELVEKAKSRKMKIDGLETAAYQLSMFDSIPYETQAQMLLESVTAEVDTNDTSFEDMVRLYTAQDLGGLYQMITQEDSEMEGFEDLLLVTRNKNWIPLIEKMAAKQTTFIAVGAGHLPGENGVINLLRAQGYDVKPIR